jgi:hypothetical protein
MPLIHAELTEMAAMPGVKGCALVEIESGMVWHTAGELQNFEEFGEAAVEFWRIYLRQERLLRTFGALRIATFVFEKTFLALTAFSHHTPPLLLVAATQQNVDWKVWGVHLEKLKVLLGETGLNVITHDKVVNKAD